MSKTWLITGASSGFGRLVTEKLLARGDCVIATVRRQGTLNALQKVYEDSLSVLTLDLNDPATITAATEKAFAGPGKIDVVLSNAGYGTFGALEELTAEQIRQQIETNLIGTVLFVQAVLPYLRAQGGARFIQVTSEGGQISYPGFSTYHASKWGQEGFIEAVRQEVAPFGIDMCLVEPGPTETGFLNNIDMGEPMKAYAETPVEELRSAFQTNEWSGTMGDAEKMAGEMIKLGDADKVPLRLPMGSIAWEDIYREYTARLNLVSEQKEIAYRCDLS